MDFMNLIQNVAFPAATTFLCMYYVREQNKDAYKERKEMREGLEKKISALTNVVAGTKSIYNIEEWED